jgi:hypothetical protein
LRVARHLIPRASGVYVFTNYDSPLAQNTGVLYVGKATTLATRLPSYLVDPQTMMLMSSRSGTPRLNTSLKHAGKVHLLVKLQQRSRNGANSGIWIRWTQVASPHVLETLLIGYLHPAFNTHGNRFDSDD